MFVGCLERKCARGQLFLGSRFLLTGRGDETMNENLNSLTTARTLSYYCHVEFCTIRFQIQKILLTGLLLGDTTSEQRANQQVTGVLLWAFLVGNRFDFKSI